MPRVRRNVSDREAVASEMVAIRGENDISQRDAAAGAGIHQSRLSRIESAEAAIPSREELSMIAVGLKCSELQRIRLFRAAGYQPEESGTAPIVFEILQNIEDLEPADLQDILEIVKLHKAARAPALDRPAWADYVDGVRDILTRQAQEMGQLEFEARNISKAMGDRRKDRLARATIQVDEEIAQEFRPQVHEFVKRRDELRMRHEETRKLLIEEGAVLARYTTEVRDTIDQLEKFGRMFSRKAVSNGLTIDDLTAE